MKRSFSKRIRRCIIVAGFLLLAGAVKQPAMTSYAADYTTQQQVAQITEYNSQQVATLGQWETQADATVKFKTYTGEYLTNAWLQDPSDSNVWYYIDEAGNRYTGLITDNSTGKTYLLGETDGKMITADGTYTIQGSQKSLSFNQIHDGTFGALSEGSLTELRTSGMTEKTVDHVGGSTTTNTATSISTGTTQKLSYEEFCQLSDAEQTAYLNKLNEGTGVTVVDDTKVSIDYNGAEELTEAMRNAMN